MDQLIPLTKPRFVGDEGSHIATVIESGWVTQGPRTQEFESRMADLLGVEHAITTSSCTAAIHLLLIAAGVGHGDEVIVPSLTFIATVNAITHAGAIPLFVDVQSHSANLDPDLARDAIGARTRAILLVDQLGYPADQSAFAAIADETGVAVIEDAACGLGSRYEGRLIGGGPFPACFSFHPRKVITTGEGGLVTLSDREAAERIRRLRNQGMSLSDLERHSAREVIFETYDEVGFNYRMTDIQASLGLRQLEVLDDCVQARRDLAHRYTVAFDGLPGVTPPAEESHIEFNYQSYMLLIGKGSSVSRDELMQQLLGDGIASRRGVMAVHREKPYANRESKLPVTEDIADSGILLPLFPDLSKAEQDRVIDRVSRHVRGAAS